MSFFTELKRRNVIRVAIAYTITAWLVAQVLQLLFESFGSPDWVMKTIIVLMGFGMVFALIFAWAYELTPDGIKRESEIDKSRSIAPDTARRLDRTIMVVLVLAVGYFVWESRFSGRQIETKPVATESTVQTGEIAAEPSIAVLPFADMSPEGDQEYFSDGIAEELLNLLARVNGLTVASRTSAFAYKDSNKGISQIAEELKVDHVLEGSVRKAQNRIRITAQLIDAKTDRHLWSATYDRELTDIFAIQDEIANAIVDALKSELGLLADAKTITVTADTTNFNAYELYLEGRALFLSRQDVGRSIELLKLAIELDPEFARAWEDLGAAYSVAEGWGVKGEGFIAKSVQAANRALELNPGLSMAWAVLGETSAVSGNYLKAFDEYDRAVQNDPLNATAWFWRGLRYSIIRYTDQAISDVEKCLELDPAYTNCYRHGSRIYMIAGKEEKALSTYLYNLRSGLAINDFWIVPYFIKHEMDHAAALLMKNESRGVTGYPYRELLYAIENPEGGHSEGVRKLVAWSEKSGVPLRLRVPELVAFGEYDQVEFSTDSNQFWLGSFAGFRASPRFKQLLIENGVLAFWLERGFPEGCRPLGEEDFECD